MNEVDSDYRGGRMRIPRSRGAASGFLLILLGVWGALIPFIGPYFDFAFTPVTAWTWTAARGWLEVLPGAVTVLGGLLLLSSRNRATAMLGGWLTVLAGAWFVVGRIFANLIGITNIGAPVASSNAGIAWLEVAYFYGLGAVIVFLGAVALGRLSVRSARDIQYAQRAVATAEPAPVAEPPTETVPPQYAEPQTERVAAAEADHPRRRRSFGSLFRRRRETTTATR